MKKTKGGKENRGFGRRKKKRNIRGQRKGGGLRRLYGRIWKEDK